MKSELIQAKKERIRMLIKQGSFSLEQGKASYRHYLRLFKKVSKK